MRASHLEEDGRRLLSERCSCHLCPWQPLPMVWQMVLEVSQTGVTLLGSVENNGAIGCPDLGGSLDQSGFYPG